MNYSNDQFTNCICSKKDVISLINGCNDILCDRDKANHFLKMRRFVHQITYRDKLLRELEEKENPDSLINKMIYDIVIQNMNRLAEDFEAERLCLNMEKEDVAVLLGTYIETCVVFWKDLGTKDFCYSEGIFRKGVSLIENDKLYANEQVNPFNMLLECIKERSSEIIEITQINQMPEDSLIENEIGVLK